MLALGGAIYESLANARARKCPIPGRLIKVDDHRLHIVCQGSGDPTVIFESGGGGSSLDWRAVQQRVAAMTRACAYDRAGVAWSDPSPDPPAADRVAADLHHLLERGGISGPYVLVGHSLGGLFAEEFAFLYPKDVAGLVLVDAAHPALATRNPPEVRRAMRKLEKLSFVMSLAARFGLARALGVSPGVDPFLLFLLESGGASPRLLFVRHGSAPAGHT